MLFGTKYYLPPPFEVLEEKSFNYLSDKQIRDLNKVITMFYEGDNTLKIHIRKIINKYPHLTQFRVQEALLLIVDSKYVEAEKILNEHLSDPHEGLAIRCSLGGLYGMSNQKEKGDQIVQELLGAIDRKEMGPVHKNHFEQLCFFLTNYYMEKSRNEFEKALKIYQWTLDESCYDLNKSLSKVIATYYISKVKDGQLVYQPPEDSYYARLLYEKLKALSIDETRISPITAELMEIIYEEIDENVFKEIEAIPDKANEFTWLLRESILSAVDTGDGEPIVHALTLMAHFRIDELVPVALELLGQDRDLLHNFVGYALEDIFAPTLHPFVVNQYDHFEAFLLRDDLNGLNQSIIMNMLCYKGMNDPQLRKKTIKLFDRLIDKYQKEKDLFRLSWLAETLSQYRYTELKKEVVKIWKSGILDEEILLGDLYDDEEIYVLMAYPVCESLADFYEFYQEKNIWYDLNDKIFDGNPEASLLSSLIHNSLQAFNFEDEDFDPDFDEEDPLLFEDEDFDHFHPPKSFIREGQKIGRNDPCPCGSGLKYKKCCLPKLN